ncbi:unnamed protein product, partial [Discosporangium mesarthrocarpum]
LGARGGLDAGKRGKGTGGGGDGQAPISIRDGAVQVSDWSQVGGDKGSHGAAGEGSELLGALHPLWVSRVAVTRSIEPVQPLETDTGGNDDLWGISSKWRQRKRGWGVESSAPGRGDEVGAEASAGDGSGAGSFHLMEPVVYFVNACSRRFQLEFPPASLGCRGGILADEMGMGKTIMLLALILSDKHPLGECEGGGSVSIPRHGAGSTIGMSEGEGETASTTALTVSPVGEGGGMGQGRM